MPTGRMNARTLIPARADVAELSELADLEKLSVLSYNVLSQMGARRLLRGDAAYVDSALLSFLHRRDVLLREVLSYDADILCLQEADDYDDFWFVRLTDAGYDSVFASSPSGARDDGLLIAFRRERFQLFRSETIDLNAVASLVSDPNLEAKCRQDRIALLLQLQPWERSRLPSAVCVVTTQLASDPAHELVRVLQTEFLCREIARVNADFQLPIVLTGSLNALPGSDVYHVLHTGRRRPRPSAPQQVERPEPQDATPSSVRLTWRRPASGDAPILGFKIAVKNCTSATLGFNMHEIDVDGAVCEHTVTMLSAGTPYQFRVAARSHIGLGPFSQPSWPITTPQAAPSKAESKANEDDDEQKQDRVLYVVDDVPPLVKPFSPSFGSGRTPRFDGGNKNMAVSPRKLLQSHWSADAKRYATLAPRADRDDALVHGEQLESAYAQYQGHLSEPEFTFASAKFIGTVDYIFYSSTQFAPFQLLALPTLEELERLGVDVRCPSAAQDSEWAKHKPRDWRDTLRQAKHDELTYMGEWVAPQLPNAFQRAIPWLPNRVFPSDHLALLCVLAVQRDELAVGWN
ncbi:hypothetical protein P43SY_004506 [Pythium insidiosum]|uniref:Fibronectin type-III domain-containing protein n=1 Tax=Pythium insidiosum TaxID=114742 RepID=A0AAD5M1G0_PYTIN|nr:hypothetical protein P43SY_004506 [Pythium insidiosum]